MRQLPPLNALRSFEAAARLASVTAAAEEMRVSHSAVSQQIKLLEEFFGQELFIRKGRSIAPTPNAVALLSDISAAFDLISIGAQRLMAQASEATISVNTTPSLALRWLIPKTSAFQIANPTINVLVQTAEADSIEHLNQPYDLIVRRFPMEKRGYRCFPLIADISTPLASPAYLEDHQIRSPEDLLPLTLLHMKSRPEAWRRWFAKHTDLDSDVIRGPFLDHFFLTLQSAISGLGVALGPLCIVEEDLEAGRLIAPLPDLTINGPGFHVLVREDQVVNHHLRKLLRALYEAAGRSFPKSLSRITGKNTGQTG